MPIKVVSTKAFFSFSAISVVPVRYAGGGGGVRDERKSEFSVTSPTTICLLWITCAKQAGCTRKCRVLLLPPPSLSAHPIIVCAVGDLFCRRKSNRISGTGLSAGLTWKDYFNNKIHFVNTFLDIALWSNMYDNRALGIGPFRDSIMPMHANRLFFKRLVWIIKFCYYSVGDRNPTTMELHLFSNLQTLVRFRWTVARRPAL